jgi:hypothetical protein
VNRPAPPPAVQTHETIVGFLCVALLCGTAFAQDDQNEIRCLKSLGPKNPVRLQVEFPSPNQLGYITYEHGNRRIPVKQLDMKETEKVSGRPSFYTLKFEEVTPDHSGGIYTLVTQGAMVEDAEYKRKDGKLFHFEDDTEALGEKGCTWKK